MESQSQLLLDDYDAENKMNNKNKSNTNIFVSPFATIIPPSNISEKKNNNQLVSKMKIIEVCSNFNNFIIKFMNLLFREIKEYKNEIIKLVKNNHEQNLKINLLMKELDDLKKYLNKYDINKKICGEKEKENSIKRIKNKFTQKENEYIVSMYKLQNEISSLIKLLDKNKDYYNKYKDAESQINNSKKKNDILRMDFNQKLNEKNLQVAIEKDKREELMNNLEELNDIIKELKEQKEKQKRQEIEITAQILKLRIINDEKNESLMMMSEELEHYIREYNKEKNNYQKTLSDLRALENKFYRDYSEEEKQK
jgi:chromosome segregation protein